MNATPLLKDLYQHITPEFAAEWKVIGTLLGLPSGELKAIEAAYPTNVKWCCNQMLEKWLEIDATASWEKLLTVIESPAVSKGDYVVSFVTVYVAVTIATILHMSVIASVAFGRCTPGLKRGIGIKKIRIEIVKDWKQEG